MSEIIDQSAATELIAMIGTGYSLSITNDSTLEGYHATIYQQAPEPMATLAWMARTCHPDTRVTFSWQLRYDFVWGQQSDLRPGADYQLGQSVGTDLDSLNRITLDFADGGFRFDDQTSGAPGSLAVKESGAVPGNGFRDQGCVGIGMSGAGTAVTPTEPNTWLQFDPRPRYWIGFGHYPAGTVLDPTGLVAPLQVQFPGGATSADCAYDGGSWRVTFA